MQDYLGRRDPKHTAHYTPVSIRGAVAIRQPGISFRRAPLRPTEG